MEVIGERGKRHFVYANLLICKQVEMRATNFSSYCFILDKNRRFVVELHITLQVNGKRCVHNFYLAII